MKLPNGYGSVIKQSGRRRKPYAARITTGWTEDGKQVKKYIGFYKTRQEAMKALAEYNENPFDLEGKSITFAQIYDKWEAYKFKGEPAPTQYRTAFKHCEPLHSSPFVDIRKRHIQSVIDNLSNGFVTARRIKTLCNQMFKYAIDMEIATTNYASLVELPKQVKSEIHKPFTPEEIADLWQRQDEFLCKVALILCYTGLRPSELLAIRKQAVNLEERYMRGGMKTDAGKNRIIPISKKILPIVNDCFAASNSFLMELDGQQISYSKLSRMFAKVFPSHLPHDGRHTCATLLDDASVPLKTRQLILGHVSQNITESVYTHKTIAQLVEAIDKI